MRAGSSLEFLRGVLPEEGYKCWVSIKDKKVVQGFVKTFEELEHKLVEIDATGANAYFACASYKTPTKRLQTNVLGAKSFWLDIDAGEGKTYANAEIALNALHKFCREIGLPLPSIIRSGYGIHAWFITPQLITAADWTDRAKKLKALCKAYNFDADPSRTSDSASILRPPGTHNWKNNTSKLVIFDGFQENVPEDFLTNIEIPTIDEDVGLRSKNPISMKKGVKLGSRNHELARRAGQCFGKGMSYEDTYKACWKWNSRNEPPLDKKEFDRTLQSIYKKECSKSDFIKLGKPDQLTMARAVINKIGRENLLSTDVHVWYWRDSGVWKVIPDRELKQYVQRGLETAGCKITKGIVDSVADILKTEIFAKEHEWNCHKDTINFMNGELHWTGETWELRPHSRENYRTTQIPYEYDPNAKCPRFLQFLAEVFDGDSDCNEKAQLLAELIGYTLISDTRYEVFVILVGSGANGKSVLLDVIRVMVGRENVAAVQPSQFGHKHQRAHLHLKLANLVTEIAEGAELADAELKAITSGELTTAEEKFQDPFDFRPFCTCWFGTNHMPHTRDFSEALFRRARIIPFNRVFQYGIDADPDLKDKLTLEIPGIINFSLRTFSEVLKRGMFTEPVSSIELKKKWRIEADQAAQFVADACEWDATAKISSIDLYSAYQRWAVSNGIVRKLNHQNFTSRIERLGGIPYKGNAGTRMISGIRLKPIWVTDLGWDLV